MELDVANLDDIPERRNGERDRGVDLLRRFVENPDLDPDAHDDEDDDDEDDDDEDDVDEDEGGHEDGESELKDIDPVTGLPRCQTPRACALRDLVDVIIKRAAEPPVPVSIGQVELFRLRLGAMAVVMGAPGAGKTTLAIALAIEHARDRGPVLFVSRELTRDEVAGRIVGMHCSVSWEDALGGRVVRDAMEAALDAPRFKTVDEDDAELLRLQCEVEALQQQFPGEPIMVVVDYVQIMSSISGNARDLRVRIDEIVDDLRRITKRLRVITIALSQTSRSSGRALRTGDSMGAETMFAGAESSAIERSAYVTLAIGEHGTPDAAGVRPVQLHLGKYRMGSGDHVIPTSYDGRTGVWKVTGSSRPTAEVRAQAKQQRHEDEMFGVAALIDARANASSEPLTKEDLAKAAGKQLKLGREGVERMLADGSLVYVNWKRARAKDPRIWTPDKAREQGLEILGGGTR